LKVAVMLMISHYYFNRDAVAAGSAMSIPHGVDAIIQAERVYDFGPIPS
jgi:hypothetical protein